MFAAEVEPISKTQSGSSDFSTRANSARPLERRVSRCLERAEGSPDATSVGPRNSFMKPLTDDIKNAQYVGRQSPANKSYRDVAWEAGETSKAWLLWCLPAPRLERCRRFWPAKRWTQRQWHF